MGFIQERTQTSVKRESRRISEGRGAHVHVTDDDTVPSNHSSIATRGKAEANPAVGLGANHGVKFETVKRP